MLSLLFILAMVSFACCAHSFQFQSPLSTHLSINLRVDRGLVAISVPQVSIGFTPPTLLQLSACDIVDGLDCQEQWSLLIRSHLRLPGASRAASDDVIVDVLTTALERVQDTLFATYGHALNDTCVTLVSPASCDWYCRDRWRQALSRTDGRMRLCGLCRETSALWQLMLSGKETQADLMIEDEFSGTNVLAREDDFYWSFVGEFNPSMFGSKVDAKEMLVDALIFLRPPNFYSYAMGALIRRGAVTIDECLAFDFD